MYSGSLPGVESGRISRAADVGLHACVPSPHEDIYLFVKRIDKHPRVREADPRRVAWRGKLIGSVVGAAVLLIGVLLPVGLRICCGYQIQSLRRRGSGWPPNNRRSN
jgi:hypothetical protein